MAGKIPGSPIGLGFDVEAFCLCRTHPRSLVSGFDTRRDTHAKAQVKIFSPDISRNFRSLL
jgi:hypothetical protein